MGIPAGTNRQGSQLIKGKKLVSSFEYLRKWLAKCQFLKSALEISMVASSMHLVCV